MKSKKQVFKLNGSNLELIIFGDKMAEIRPIHKQKCCKWQKTPGF
jgi:hypothetical protein